MFQWLYFIKLAAPLLKRGPAFYELYKKEIEEIKTINLYVCHFYIQNPRNKPTDSKVRQVSWCHSRLLIKLQRALHLSL